MTNAIAHYIAEFAALKWQLPGNDNLSLQNFRQTACDYFSQNGFPSRKQEEWKYTDTYSLANYPFTAAIDPTIKFDQNQLLQWQIPELDCYQLVFINGLFSAEYSKVTDLDFETVAKHCSSQYDFQSTRVVDAFHALNNAFMRDGLLLKVKKNTALIKPIHILHITTQQDLMTNTRNKIELEAGATATIIESFVGYDDVTYFTNTITEIKLNEQSQCAHYKLQQQGTKALHVDRLLIQQASQSKLEASSFSSGGEWVRSDTEVQCAEGTTSELVGLYLGQNKQHMDHHITLHHLKGHGKSRQFYKGVLSQQAHAVFNGKVIVEKDAQKTDAQQVNRNLLLSPQAEVATKPQLEIAADDVKCSHGTTVGQLDEKALFYLQSRAISLDQAKRLMVHGFCCDMIDKINLPPLQQKLHEIIEGISWPTK